MKVVSCLFVALFILVLGVSACGKRGDPAPRVATRSFVWQDVEASASGNCIDVRATMSGIYENLESISLEVAPVDMSNNCAGCPFIPAERYSTSDIATLLDKNSGVVSINYCPTVQSPVYRIILVGKNVFDTSRHAVSNEIFVNTGGEENDYLLPPEIVRISN